MCVCERGASPRSPPHCGHHPGSPAPFTPPPSLCPASGPYLCLCVLPRSFTNTFTVVKLKSELDNTLEPTSVLGQLHVSRPGLTQPPPSQRCALGGSASVALPQAPGGGHTPVPLLPPASRVRGPLQAGLALVLDPPVACRLVSTRAVLPGVPAACIVLQGSCPPRGVCLGLVSTPHTGSPLREVGAAGAGRCVCALFGFFLAGALSLLSVCLFSECSRLIRWAEARSSLP